MILQLCEVKVIIIVTLSKFPHIPGSSAQGRALKSLSKDSGNCNAINQLFDWFNEEN